VISTHGPAVFKDIVTTAGKVNLLSIHHDDALSRSNTPNDGNIMLFTTAIGSGLAFRQSLSIGKSKSPTDATLGTGNALSTSDGSEIYLIYLRLTSTSCHCSIR
jgi:hypothetical protein